MPESRAAQPSEAERRLLQIAVAIAACVPVTVGLAGIFYGLGSAASASTGSHFRYLSGVLLAIGLAFWASIPNIETRGNRFALLTILVVVGGCARLYGAITTGSAKGLTLFGLGMELFVTPGVWAWQRRIAGRPIRS